MGPRGADFCAMPGHLSNESTGSRQFKQGAATIEHAELPAESGASRKVTFFLWSQCVCTGPRQGHCTAQQTTAQSGRRLCARPGTDLRTRRKTGRDAIGPESKPWAGTSLARRVRLGEGRLNSEPDGGEDLAPRPEKTGGHAAAACNGLRIAARGAPSTRSASSP